MIKNLTTGVVDALFSLSPSAPTLPSVYTVFRRVASVFRTSAAILAYYQLGDYFGQPTSQMYNYTSVMTYSLNPVTRCPLGIITFPIMKPQITPSAAGACYLTLGCGLNSNIKIQTIAQQNLASTVNHSMVTNIATNLASQIYVGTTFGGQCRVLH
jgi:hypothetical protein